MTQGGKATGHSSATRADEGPSTRVWDAFRDHVQATPSAVAVRCDGHELTYAALHTRVLSVSAQLRAQGAGRGRFVAVLLPRSLDLPVALMAIHHCGAAYLPIDPDYPASRIAHVVQDAAAPILITCAALKPRIGATSAVIVQIDATDTGAPANVDAVPMDPEDPFYLIYTSGSTGMPKGSILPLRGPINQFSHYRRFMELSAASRTLVFTSPGFDMTQCNLWVPLMTGGTVVMSGAAVYDPRALLDLIERERITHINCTPSAFYPLLEDATSDTWRQLSSLRFLALGGEGIQLARLEQWRASPGFACTIVNSYGPTECSAKVAMHPLAPGVPSPSPFPVGAPIDNLQLYVLGPQLEPLPAGAEGELCVAGVGVGSGYLNRPELNADRFPPNPFGPGRLYRTGDRARQRDDGLFEVVGRLDGQVKIRGFRVELGEIEAVLAGHAAVREAAASVATPGDRLCAYVVLREGQHVSAHELRDFLAARVPDAMLPSAWTFLDRLPLSPHGKLDRSALPAPTFDRPALAVAYASPRGALEIWLASEIGERLGCANVGRDDPFFELGGDSLTAVRFVAQVSRKLRLSLPVVDWFASPTVAGYAASLLHSHAEAVTAVFGMAAGGSTAATRPGRRAASARLDARSGDIAIVGMSVRLPGADDVDTFWSNLREGVESIRQLTDAELDAAGVDAQTRSDPNFVRAAATLSDPDCFDAAFFGYSPREAAVMDPQQRLLLECAWSALEHSGQDPSRAGRVGVFAGVARNSYFQYQLAHNPSTRSQLAEVHVTFGNDKDYAATRVSFRLNLTGPAFTAQTACSTGGVLVHLARQSLLNHECDAAIVGGARVVCPLNAGYLWVDGSIMSRDGRMRAFDAQGSGMIRGSGATCVVLKRREDAERDGDTIYAVIKGSALNNDGADKAGYAAPSVGGQAEVIELALEDAGVSADTISYVEAHGTSTHLGDPIEVSALTRAFRRDTSRNAYCRIGSVKSNVGHLDPAAGIASLVKTALMLHHRQIVPTVGFDTPNPNIDFASSPFRVADRLESWDVPLRRAGLSAFGIGGTNAHLVLEEAASTSSAASERAPRRPWQLLPVSAKTDTALADSAARIGAWAQGRSAVELADAAWTLQTGRASFDHRGVALVREGTSPAAEAFIRGKALPAARLLFVFPGQGSQHPGMGRDLYESEPVYRAVIDEGCEILRPLLELDLRDVLYPGVEQAEAAAEQLRQTVLAQPAIFLVSYALARLWDSLGVRPEQMIGHSVGEFVAATLAGVFEFADALKLLAARARLMQSMPGGSMMAVRLAEADVRARGAADVGIAAINAPGLTIVSGPTPAIDAFETDLKGQGIGAMRLHTSHAFHSAMMEPIVARFAEEVARVPRSAPRLPIVSTLTGEWMTEQQAQDPQYWARQLREAVRFAPAVSTALSTPGCVLLEVGPGQSLSGPLRQVTAAHPASASAVVSSAPPAGQDGASAAEHLMLALGRLWIAGVTPDWGALHGGPRRRVGLPGYPFARTRHWIEATDAVTAAGAISVPDAQIPIVSPAESATPAAAAGDPVRDRAVGILADLTGLEFPAADDERSFLDLGMDSLLLTQVAGKLKNAFKVELRFRQLLEEFSSPAKLLVYLRQHGQLASGATPSAAAGTAAEATADNGTPKKAFGAAVRISKQKDVLSPIQRGALDRLMQRYMKRTGGSRTSAQQHRRYFADPRTVSGFKPMWKDIVYPIVSTRSQGAYLWDVDGNEYIDTVNGFGATIFGHKPPFVDAALREQIDKGYEVGPVQDFLGECAHLFSEMVQLDRVAFCNTGSEAVSAAQRCARTATGKDLIASFAGDYHGIHDEVIVRPGPGGRGMPAAGGIPASHTANTLILDYGDPKSLEVLRARADELAAIMIEPIQSRNQGLQPREFIHHLRELCTQAQCAFIMDEVITGFRLAQGGAQAFFDVKADLATYGKVFGGGMPVGALAGIPKYMDALDGGYWDYGDASVPEAGVTYFAGTFVRHPLAMAATLATLKHLRAHPGLQEQLNARVAIFVSRLREALARLEAPVQVSTYTSIFRFEVSGDEPFGELLAHYFRLNGVHTYDHRNQIMTTAHTEAVMDRMFEAYIGGVSQMQKDGLLGRVGAPIKLGLADSRPGSFWYAPPVLGARLGRDPQGLPRWYQPDPDRAGRWIAVDESVDA